MRHPTTSRLRAAGTTTGRTMGRVKKMMDRATMALTKWMDRAKAVRLQGLTDSSPARARVAVVAAVGVGVAALAGQPP